MPPCRVCSINPQLLEFWDDENEISPKLGPRRGNPPVTRSGAGLGDTRYSFWGWGWEVDAGARGAGSSVTQPGVAAGEAFVFGF